MANRPRGYVLAGVGPRTPDSFSLGVDVEVYAPEAVR